MKIIKKPILLFSFLLIIFSLFGKDIYTFAQRAQQNINQNIPRVNISKTSYQRGGLISISSESEPAISLNSWNMSGEVTLKLYKANEQALLQYLVHDKENKQKNPKVKTDDLEFIAEFKKNIVKSSRDGQRVDLPLEESGIWYLTMEIDDATNSVFIVRSKNGLVVKESKNNLIVWGQQFDNLRRMNQGTVQAYNLLDQASLIEQTNLDSEGLAKLSNPSKPDIIILRHEDDIAITPVNLRYINIGSGYQVFGDKTSTKYFVFADRPLYKPGGKVYFKAIIRDDEDARYSASSGMARVIIYKDWQRENKIFDKYYPINNNGAIDGEFQLPEHIATGYYSILVTHSSEDINAWNSGSTASFQVEHYRKPEYSINADNIDLEVIKGDKTSFIISGQYFSGQPLMNKEVKYEVHAVDAYDSQYLNESLYQDLNRNYGRGRDRNIIITDSTTLDNKGHASVNIDTASLHIPDNLVKILTLKASFIDQSGNPVESSQNIVLYPGEFSIYRTEYSRTQKVGQEYLLKLKLTPHGSFNTNDIKIKALASRSWWEKEAVSSDRKYPRSFKQEENIGELSAISNQNGEVIIKMTPEKPGSYTFKVDATDSRDNTITKIFHAWIRDDDYNYFYDYGPMGSDLQISADQPSYQPGDTANITIDSKITSRDALLSIQRGRVDRYEVVALDNESSNVELPIIDDDMPNTFARVNSFNQSGLDTSSVKLMVPANKKKINVMITPDQNSYGPRETAVVNILTQDMQGNPVPAEVTLWSVDKALYELVNYQTKDIFTTFWKERYESAVQTHSLEGINVYGAEGGGGCFLKDTQVLMANGTTKYIQNIKSGEKILTKSYKNNNELVTAKVNNTHQANVGGYVVINQTLKVTPDHLMFINGQWSEAGKSQIGDRLVSSDGKTIQIESLEWIKGKTQVYNLEIDKYHTYFANGVWVHNDKGDTRSIFKDTAYWNPSIQTDANGRAQINIPLPDNLTTWVIAGIASNATTQVGQSTSEIKVSKDIVVRPILPNILRTEDKIVLSSLLHNFTNKEQIFQVNLDLPGATIKQSTYDNLIVPAESLEEISWDVTLGTQEIIEKLKVSAKTKDGAIDEVIQEIPILARGFSQKQVFVSYEPSHFSLKLAEDINIDKSEAVLSLSSTQVGTLPTTMEYLIDYPYGCVEQTTSRLIPVLFANENKTLFANVIKDKNLDEMVAKGLARLEDLQQSDGGWSWWTHRRSEPFITAYVIEHLLLAEKQGYELPLGALDKAINYLEKDQFYSFVDKKQSSYNLEDIVMKTYALSLLDHEKGKKTFDTKETNKLSSDILPYAIMVNFKNGIKNPSKNGLGRLIALAKEEGEGLYWEAGKSTKFSSINSATALAARTIMLTADDTTFATRAIRYLTTARKQNYWSNTFGTVQVAKAMLEFAKTRNELNADYNYTITLDGTQIAQGHVSSQQQLNKTITIPANKIKQDESVLLVEKEGQGQIYSTLIFDQFYTKSEPSNEDNKNQGIIINREYISDKGSEYKIMVGDLVTVNLTVEGIDSDVPYLVIEDELPAGLIPINTKLKNQENNKENYNYWENREYTQNGIIIALESGTKGKKVFSYQARAIAVGDFYAPPAKAELMYLPEVRGMSKTEIVTITKDPSIIPAKLAEKTINDLKEKITNTRLSLQTKRFLMVVFAVVLLLLGLIFYLLKKQKQTLSTLLKKLISKIIMFGPVAYFLKKKKTKLKKPKK